MKTYLIRGVPQAVQRDGWWLNGATPRESTGGTAQTDTSDTLRAGLLLALIMSNHIAMPSLAVIFRLFFQRPNMV